MMYYIGIDPGANGGIAVIDDECHIVCTGAYSMEAYRDCLKDFAIDVEVRAVVEDVHAMPGQGVTSMFNFGRNKGFIEGMLYAYNIPETLVAPQKWKRHFGLIAPKGTDKKVIKRMSIDKAISLFGDTPVLYKTERCKAPHDGIYEALLMALYLKETSDAN